MATHSRPRSRPCNCNTSSAWARSSAPGSCVRQAAPQHGRARPHPARRPHWRSTRPKSPAAAKKRSRDRRRRTQPPGQDADRRRRRGRGRRGSGPGRIRLKEVPDYSAASLHPFIADNLAPGAIAKTDGWSALSRRSQRSNTTPVGHRRPLASSSPGGAPSFPTSGLGLGRLPTVGPPPF